MKLRQMWVVAIVLAGVAGPSAAAEVTAVLDWARRIELGTPVSGVIAGVLAQPGQRVAAGQELVKLDGRRFQAELARTEAEVRRLQLARTEAEQELERAEELYERTVISNHDLEQARIDFSAADARFIAARAARVQAQIDVDDSVVRAPMDAIVVKRMAEVGQTVVNRLQVHPLMVVAQADRMAARAELEAAVIAGLSVGDAVTVRVGSRSYPGEITGLGFEPVGDAGGGPRYPVMVTFDPGADAGRLRPGQPGTVDLP